MIIDRREVLLGTALLVGCSRGATKADDADEVTPVEDLMREHGVLRRVMYVYDEAAARLETQRDTPLDALARAVGIVRRVIEDYHEKLEEEFVFPRFQQAGKLVELAAMLREQHQIGRTITDDIIAASTGSDRARIAAGLRKFNHMYRPHAAREDTVLFPEFRGLVGKRAYAELGDQFEARETQKLGDHGFEHAVAEVATIEAAFGLDDLAKL